MDKKMLVALQKRNKARLVELRSKLEKNEVREDEIATIQTEIEELAEEATAIAEAIAELDSTEDTSTDADSEDRADTEDDKAKDTEDAAKDGEESDAKDDEKRGAILSAEKRSKAMKSIASALSTRNAKSSKTREKEIRSAFANFVVGNITEVEARSLGIEVGNGSVTVPEVIASEVISYAQEENLLRKYGSSHKTTGDVKYPVLVKKAKANVNKKERSAEIVETDIEFDEILLDPAEFDALATVTKKLLKMSGVNVEEIVVEELKKAYVEKEINYMFRGDDASNENPGSLQKKAVAYYETEAIDVNAAGYSQKLYQQLVKLKGQPVTAVLKKSMWIVNRAALTILEGMTDTTGRPLLHEAKDGVGYTLLGHKLDFTDAANKTEDDHTTPVFYFGDFSAFHIQDVVGSLEMQKLIEKFSGTNKVGFQIYNLLDGQLIYSPFEPAVYRYEVGSVKGA